MTVFSVEGKGLKFNSEEDIRPFLADLKDDVVEINLSGNTFGVDASIALANALRNKSKLEVCSLMMEVYSKANSSRSLRWPTFSLGGSVRKFQPL